MRNRAWVTSLVLLSLAGISCKSNGSGPTTKLSEAPPSTMAAPVPVLARLSVTPAAIRANGPATPGSGVAGAKSVTLHLTLIVSNPTGRAYTGESPDSSVARFALTIDGEPYWSDDRFVTQVVTPVTIGAGQQVTYSAAVTIPDVRPLKGKVLTARAYFAPAALSTSTAVPVN